MAEPVNNEEGTTTATSEESTATSTTEELIPVEVKPEYIHADIPSEYICVYHKILIMLADYGVDLIKDCKASCANRNTKIVECYHMFLAALSARKLNKIKVADTLIKHIKSQINLIYKDKDNSTSFVFPVDDKGEIKAFVKCEDTPKVYINPEDEAAYEAYMKLISEDVVDGKTKLAAQITAKGVKAYNTESLIELAGKIEEIPQTVFKGVSEFENAVLGAPAWNPASIAHNLQEETLPDYFPAYMDEYRKNYLSYWVAESMYTNIETATLEGADGYYTSDGHFYQRYGTQYIHTFPNGTTETITNSTHIWDNDSSVNRFVVYFYLSSSYTINIANDNNYTKLVIVGQCGGISLIGADTISDIWNFGEITGTITVNQTSGAHWNSIVTIRGYKRHSNNVLVYKRHVQFIYLPDLEECSYNLVSEDSNYTACDPTIFILQKLKKINTRAFLLANMANGLSNILFLSLPALEELNVPLIACIGQPSTFANKLRYIELNNLEVLNITSTGGAFNVSKGIISYGSNIDSGYGALNRITIPKLKRVDNGFIMWSFAGSTAANLIDIEVGEMETDLYLRYWNPINILNSIAKIKQLLENIKNHIALKVSDRSGATALNVTFGFTSTLNSHSDSEVSAVWTEIKQIFTNKNWNVL